MLVLRRHRPFRPAARRLAPRGRHLAGLLEARRHVADQAGFDAVERATLAEVTCRLLVAVRTATGCDGVYQWATTDGYEHFHLWLVPWSEDANTRGPRYLVDAVVDRAPDEAATLAASEQLHRALLA